jgi:hypothetical protein
LLLTLENALAVVFDRLKAGFDEFAILAPKLDLVLSKGEREDDFRAPPPPPPTPVLAWSPLIFPQF